MMLDFYQSIHVIDHDMSYTVSSRMAGHPRLKGPLPRGPFKIGRCIIFVDVSNECILLWHKISTDCDGIVWDTVTVSIGVW